MIRLMIVEDEALERKALNFLLNKYYKDKIEVVYEASNGIEAAEKAESLRPDIILMDINMPRMNGLEAGKLIKSRNEDIEIIILTAFNYFEYAKKAIGIGVDDYLLKPVSNEEFFKAIDSLIKKIEDKRINKLEQKQLNENYMKLIPLVEKEVITGIVYGNTLDEKSLDEYKRFLNVKSSYFTSIVFNSDRKNLFNEETVCMIKNRLSFLFTEIIGYICLNNIILFIFDDEVNSKIHSTRFENVLLNIQRDFKFDKEINLYTGIGGVGRELSELYLSYKQAKQASESKKKIITYYNGKMDDTDISAGMSDKEAIICGKLINEDINGALGEFEDVINHILQDNDDLNFEGIKNKILQVCNVVIENIMEFIGREFTDLNKEDLAREFNLLPDITDLKYFTGQLIKNLADHVSSYKNDKNTMIVEKVRKYIEENYMREITLEEVSNYVCMSSFYLSRVFRRIEGMNFKDYLIKIRMENAKKMILEGKKTIKQISIEVGYPDQNYFSRAFKKYTHLSPKEYSILSN